MSHIFRWGVSGTANIARRKFVPAILKSNVSEVAAIGSRDKTKAEEFANEFQIAKAYGSYQEVQ